MFRKQSKRVKKQKTKHSFMYTLKSSRKAAALNVFLSEIPTGFLKKNMRKLSLWSSCSQSTRCFCMTCWETGRDDISLYLVCSGLIVWFIWQHDISKLISYLWHVCHFHLNLIVFFINTQTHTHARTRTLVSAWIRMELLINMVDWEKND